MKSFDGGKGVNAACNKMVSSFAVYERSISMDFVCYQRTWNFHEEAQYKSYIADLCKLLASSNRVDQGNIWLIWACLALNFSCYFQDLDRFKMVAMIWFPLVVLSFAEWILRNKSSNWRKLFISERDQGRKMLWFGVQGNMT